MCLSQMNISNSFLLNKQDLYNVLYETIFTKLESADFWEVVPLERGPLSLVMIIEELFQGNSGSGLENRN
jgi:hypothetical protein